MDLTTVYWFVCIALAVAIFVMTAGLVAIATTAYESIQRIMSGRNTKS